jgi:hypothetical protein
MRLLVVHKGTPTGLMEGLREAGAHVDEMELPNGIATERCGMYRHSYRDGIGIVRNVVLSPADAEKWTGLCTRESFLRRATGYDSVLICKGMQFSLADLEWLGAQVDLTYVLFDTITCGPPGREQEHGERALRCARAIVTGREAVEWLRARTDRAVAQIIQGFRPRIWSRPPTRHGGRRTAVTFVGSLYEGDGGRADKLAVLRRARIDVAHYGHRGAQLAPVMLERASRIYNGAALVLNFVPHTGTFSNRVVRVLASGGCLLSEYAQDLTPMFPGGLAQFSNEAEMLEHAHRLIANPSEREAIAAVGHEHAQRYTWARQAEKYMRFIRGEFIPDDGVAPCI